MSHESPEVGSSSRALPIGRPELGRSGLSGYRVALRVRPFRRLFIGQALSGLGDGCGFVAVAWLALQLAAPPQRPYAVGLAMAAYSLPGAVVGLGMAGRLATLPIPGLLIADAALRGLLLGAIPILWAAGTVPLWAYITLLAGSSLLASIGRGGYVTVVADHVAEPHRFAANSLLGSTEAVTVTLVGPALGGVLVATAGAPVTLGIDAASFIGLLWAALALPNARRPRTSRPQPVRLRSVLRRPLIAWLLALTVVFYGLYGPFETALPVYVHSTLHAGAALYGAMWASFGGGALIGSFLAGTRTIEKVEAFAVVVVAGWGVCVILVGAITIPAVIAAGMAVGGLIYAPYPAITTTTLQRLLPSGELAAGAAGWFALLTLVTPATTAAGGPLVATIGARCAIVASGAATVALAVLVTAIHQRSQQRHRQMPMPTPDRPPQA